MDILNYTAKAEEMINQFLALAIMGTSVLSFSPSTMTFTSLASSGNSLLSERAVARSPSRHFSSAVNADVDSADVALPTKGCIVTIDCRLQPEGEFVPEPLVDGIVLEDYDPPQRLTFVLGEGNYLPGLHDLVSTMTIGQKAETSIDAGWGERNPSLVATLSLDSLKDSGIDPSKIKEGVKLVLSRGVPAVVTSVTENEFTIDANPPLAGASYKASVELLSFDPPIPGDLEYNPSNDGTGSKYEVATFALGTYTVSLWS